MRRRQFLTTLTLAAGPGGVSAQPVATAKPPQDPTKQAPIVTPKAVMVIDVMTGQILFQKNAREKRAVASTQKLLTALLLCEAGNLDRLATAAAYDEEAEPTKIYLKPGADYPRREILKAMLMKSANDCARCLARTHAGSEDAFAVLMNKRAELLGMEDSHFVNASGLPGDQHSTARDMALLARAAYLQPVIRSIVCQAESTFTHADGRVVKLHNTNHLLTSDPYCNGMKTGYTDAAGKCLICSAAYKGRTVIAVLLGGTSAKIWTEGKALLHWALGVP